MDKNKIYVIVIAVLILGSTLGFAMISFSGRQQIQPQTGNLPPLENQPTTFEYTTQNTPATVTQMLPSLSLAGETEEKDIKVIDTAVYSIPEVRAIQSSFSIPPEGSDFSLIYSAKLSFSSDVTAEYIIEQIREKAPLGQMDALTYALVEIPQQLTLQSKNNPEFTQEHEFESNVSEALVSLGTAPLDEIEVEINVTLAGKKVMKLFAFETRNLNTEPTVHTYSEEFEISTLEIEKELTFLTSGPLLNIDADELETEITELENIESAEVTVQTLSENFIVEILTEVANVTEMKSGIETSLPEIEGVESIEFAPEEEQSLTFLQFLINFDHSSDFPALSAQVEEELLALGLGESDYFVSEPLVSIIATITLSETDALQTSALLKALLETKNITTDIYQSVTIPAESFTDTETATTYANDSGMIKAYIVPENLQAETILLEITYTTSRNSTVSAFGAEPAEETGQ